MKTKSLFLGFFFLFTIFVWQKILAQNFTQITIGPHVNDHKASLGCSWIDFDNDGDEDLFVTNGSFTAERNYLYLNEGPDSNFSFTSFEDDNFINDMDISRASTWGDYNNDGYADLYIANDNGPSYNILYFNNRGENFSRIKVGAIATDFQDSEPATWVDYDNDGYLDLLVGNNVKNGLYHNNGDGSFTRITAENTPGSEEHSLRFNKWADFDNDGDQDVILGFIRTPVIGVALYINQGGGYFERITEGMILDEPDAQLSHGNWVDYDNDGDWDLIDVGTAIYMNERTDSGYYFTKLLANDITTDEAESDFSSWADFDNDGDIDCFISKFGDRNFLFANNGDGSFSKIDTGAIISQSITSSAACAWADYDNDGDMDIYVSNQQYNFSNNLFYRNDNNNGNSWLKVKLTGTASNASAIGAVVKVKANTGAGDVWQMRAIEGQSCFMGQNSLIAHFGLGKATLVDSIIVYWPAGHVTILTDTTVNQQLNITEDIPESFLRAEFMVDTTLGRSELLVQFTDRSLFDPDHPITSWWWDFDGDGAGDSQEQNPNYLFNSDNAEVYDVTLVISNGVNSDTIHRWGLIKVISPDGNNAMLGNAIASSELDLLSEAWKSIDDDVNSIWASNPTDDEWLQIELDEIYSVCRVIIQWDRNYAKEYSILTSADGVNWNIVYTEDSGDGEWDTLIFESVDAKYVKWEGTKGRRPNTGYSIREFEIYGSGCETKVDNNQMNYQEAFIYPNPFHDELVIEQSHSFDPHIRIEIIDVSGNILVSRVSYARILKLDMSGLESGIYLIRISNSKYTSVKKVVKY